MTALEELELKSFGTEVAWDLGVSLREKAQAGGLPLAITIRKANGALMFHSSLPGSTADNAEWAERKAAITLRFEQSSHRFGLLHEQVRDHPLMVEWIDLTRYAPVGGAIPITVAPVGMVGVVAVSGLPGSGDQDFLASVLA